MRGAPIVRYEKKAGGGICMAGDYVQFLGIDNEHLGAIPAMESLPMVKVAKRCHVERVSSP